ncbi:hypothetical protein K438DRAFT_2062620 [Mycena galopus ATCC 62051]|nr:hypothetical protein K438DRAFT_2062620 [Mycena galopus ATCC 62051]
MDVDNTPTRVEELWFSDSGLVVQAEQSLYRVSGAVLATRSPVFKDMLAFVQPAGAGTIDGCPIVNLPDSAEDVTCFFRAIFDSSIRFNKILRNLPFQSHFDSILSITRLSHKYAVEYLLRRALVHLSDYTHRLRRVVRIMFDRFLQNPANTSLSAFHRRGPACQASQCAVDPSCGALSVSCNGYRNHSHDHAMYCFQRPPSKTQ